MKTPEQIQSIADGLGVKINSNKKSFADLHKYIADDETISSILDFTGQLIVITNKKLLLMSASIMSAPDAKEFALGNIANVETDLGFLMSELKFVSAGKSQKIVHTKKDAIIDLKNKLSTAITSASKPTTVTIDIASQLEKLAALKAQGILTDEEFVQQKMKLLA